MSRRYDSRTTIFSPEGRLYQVEYAMEAISHAGTVLGILSSDGIVLIAEKKASSKLLEADKSMEKIYVLDQHVVCGVAGITSDANLLIDYARRSGQTYLSTYNSGIPIEVMVTRVCNVKQSYTQYGGMRPFGVSILYAGYDPHYGLQLYSSDPSGNYHSWKATCIGSNTSSAQSLLKQEYPTTEEEFNNFKLDEAIKLAIKILSKTMDTTTLTSDKLEFSTVKLKNEIDFELKIYNPDELDKILKLYENSIPKDDTAE